MQPCCCNLLSMWLDFHRAAAQICLWMKHLIREKSHHLRRHCENLKSDCTSRIFDISKTPNCKVTATCKQMNAPCEHLRRKKAPQYVFSIRQDKGQVLPNVGNIPFQLLQCTSGQWKFLESARTCPYMFIYLSRCCEHVYRIELRT